MTEEKQIPREGSTSLPEKYWKLGAKALTSNAEVTASYD